MRTVVQWVTLKREKVCQLMVASLLSLHHGVGSPHVYFSKSLLGPPV